MHMDHSYNRIPIIKLWHVLLIPLQGELTDELADQLTAEVLDRIHREGTSGIVVDITGLWMVDSHLCSVLSQLSAAAQLLGAKTIISGLKPDIALTLETMGIELHALTTALDLEAALLGLGFLSPTARAGRNLTASIASGDPLTSGPSAPAARS